jgi:hypothetical protein
MAKRSRLAGRPGQRRPLQRPTGRAEAARRPSSSLTDQELARAAELEAAILAEQQAAADARASRERGRRSSVAPAGVTSTSVPLAVREADEYRYVQRDVRRIVLVGAFLLGILAVLDVLVNGLHLFTL